MNSFSRREVLKSMGFATGALSFSQYKKSDRHFIFELDDMKSVSLNKTVTAITLGAGNRGNVYGNYAAAYPDNLDIIGVAEPISIRNQRYMEKHNIAPENSFTTWEHVFEKPKFADAIIITTPDDLHYGPAMAALAKGYDILLEKPISPSEKECLDILDLAQKNKRIVAVCHVLRYAPYFVKLKEMISTGKLGQLISVQHFEPIEHIHMSHSFVRGNWHNSKTSTPIILAKSCHDLDMLRWLIDEPCQHISAFGNLTWFNENNKPKGAPKRCIDGCPVESSCPYSALKIYHRDRQRTYVFDFPEDESKHSEFILEQLRTTNYGRCVYQMENDQQDHYVCSMQFDKDITAAFSMEAFTSYHGRKTRLMGSMGDIRGDMNTFHYTDFLTGEKTIWDVKENVEGDHLSGHGGGDWRLVQDWLMAVDKQDPSLLTSTIEASVESHLMGFAAEKSRLNKTVEAVSTGR